MMFEGLWVGKWLSNISSTGVSSGVLVFQDGKIFGGNDRVFYLGTFTSDGDRFFGNVKVSYYAGEPLGIFGLLEVDQTEEISIRGYLSRDEITLEGILKSNPKAKLRGLLQRKALM